MVLEVLANAIKVDKECQYECREEKQLLFEYRLIEDFRKEIMGEWREGGREGGRKEGRVRRKVLGKQNQVLELIK